jgi:hypothetical protein
VTFSLAEAALSAPAELYPAMPPSATGGDEASEDESAAPNAKALLDLLADAIPLTIEPGAGLPA